VSAFLSGLIVTGIVLRIDPKSIISARRFFGLQFASTCVWLVPLFISIPFSYFLKNAPTNEFVLGAFLAWGFELVIINGAFLRSTTQSLLISAIHPVPILLIVLAGASHNELYSLMTGVTVLIAMLAFLARIDSVKTRNGVSSLRILRSFLKTWVEHEPDELEKYFSGYANNAEVTSDLIIAQREQSKIILVLPGIHPGPFSPIGSYNLSELIYRELKNSDTFPVVMHGTGGHERNVPSNRIASDYAIKLSQFIRAQKQGKKTLMRGPLRSKVGITSITTLSFDDHVLLLISNSPYRSDDLDPSTMAHTVAAATDLHVRIMVVDAHNCVDGPEEPQEQISKDQWTKILADTLQAEEREFRIGAANSEEIGFKHGTDISDGGISMVIFSTVKSKWALVTADSNNAKSGLREKVSVALNSRGTNLVELCTSDTHKLAARGLTSRGYFALGEQTEEESLMRCIMELAKLAESRLDTYDLQVATFQSDVPLIGTQSIDDFATLTKTAILLSKRYTKIILPAILILLTITLFY
jgi:putative membrane protein